MTELFVATGDGLAQLVPQGNDWTVTMMLEGSGMRCLTLDPHNSDTIYAGSRGKGVWKSRDRGVH
jgi:hypothetical protein